MLQRVLGFNGALVMPMPLAVHTVRGINLVNTGSILVDKTLDTGERFAPLYAVVRSKTIAGLSGNPSISIGVTGAGYTDIIANTAVSGISAANQQLTLVPIANATLVAPNTKLFVKVNTGATATAYIADIDVIGYYTFSDDL